MNNLASHLADSGLFMVGNAVHSAPNLAMGFIGEDEDSHVAVFEEWDQRCMCCCCTGECRDDRFDGPSFEEVLSEGFVEGCYDK